jgi:hypothetical protein
LATAKHNRTKNSNLTVYLFADSPKLVDAMVEFPNFIPIPSAVDGETEQLESQDLLASVLDEISPIRIVGRTNSSHSHIAGTAESPKFSDFANAFVDLYIASQARCVTVGVGRYGILAALIGGNSCLAKNTHQVSGKTRNMWGMSPYQSVPDCPAAR